MLHPFPHHRGAGEPIVELKGVTAGYEGQKVLADVNLRIMPGDFVGLLGPSGSGKTTLLRTILGAARVFQGTVAVKGSPAVPKGSQAGYVPQLETIDWNFPVTVEEVVLMGCTRSNPFFPWHRRQDRERAHQMMDRLSIAHLFRRHIRELSGGQQQRVFLARALVSSPSLLLLDEPTSGVDIKTRDEVMHLLHELNHQGITVVLTTHEINAVAAHLPWLVCLKGHILAEGPPAQVISPEILRMTYGAEMPVIEYQGLSLVAESPHFFGRNGSEEKPGQEAREASELKPALKPEGKPEKTGAKDMESEREPDPQAEPEPGKKQGKEPAVVPAQPASVAIQGAAAPVQIQKSRAPSVDGNARRPDPNRSAAPKSKPGV